MKLIQLFFLFAIGFTACQHSTTAQEPRPSTLYTANQLDSLFLALKYAADIDIYQPDAVVVTNFNNHFPSAKDVEWEKKKGFFTVDFEIKHTDYEALYDYKGNLIVYKYDITRSSVPKAVKEAAKIHYPQMRIDDAEKIITVHAVCYKIKMERGEREINAYFDEKGAFLEKPGYSD